MNSQKNKKNLGCTCQKKDPVWNLSDLKKSGNSEKKSPINQNQQNEIMHTNNSAREKRILKLKNEKKISDSKQTDNSETKQQKPENSKENQSRKKNRNDGRRKKKSPAREKIKVFFGNKFPD